MTIELEDTNPPLPSYPPPTVLSHPTYIERAREERRMRSRCSRADDGSWLCACGTALGPNDDTVCAACMSDLERRREMQTREHEVKRLHSAFHSYVFGRGFEEPLTHPPRWEWARFGNSEFRERVSSKGAGKGKALLEALEGYWPPGDMIVSASTGWGKSALCWAWLNEMRDRAVAKARAGEKARIISFAWITGPELSGCRRRWRIGEESPLVKLATTHDLLILDEVGFEPISEELFFVLDHRYRSGASTLVTTGLKYREFKARYEAALIRRLLERGQLVEAWT